jgi:hypothetical protein
MSKSSKIIIGVVVVAIIAVVGYALLNDRNSNADQGVIMGAGNPYDAQHLQRTLSSGGTPGDGGGG